MKKINLALFIILSILYLNGVSQITFEKGYIIDNTNQKIDCYIKNMDWKNNPSQFEYKLAGENPVQIKSIESAKEFGIYGVAKYVRDTVLIDRSSNKINEMDNKREPIFRDEVLYLNVLLEGKANLYLYEDVSIIRFFYAKENGDIEQLVYKNYLSSQTDILENNRYQQQLYNHLNCPSFKLSDFTRLSYKKSSLVKIFTSYNNCIDGNLTSYSKKQDRKKLILSLRPRINVSMLKIGNELLFLRDRTFNVKGSFGMGIEGEYFLPFNKNAWSVILEPSYQSYNSEFSSIETNTINYKSIEIPLGIRYNFFQKDDKRIFINGLVVYDIAFNSTIIYQMNSTLKIKSNNNLAFGFGGKWNKRFSIEGRYQFSRDVLSEFRYWFSDYHTFSLILGYSFFNK